MQAGKGACSPDAHGPPNPTRDGWAGQGAACVGQVQSLTCIAAEPPHILHLPAARRLSSRKGGSHPQGKPSRNGPSTEPDLDLADPEAHGPTLPCPRRLAGCILRAGRLGRDEGGRGGMRGFCPGDLRLHPGRATEAEGCRGAAGRWSQDQVPNHLRMAA